MRTVRTLAALAISVTFVGACTPAAEQEVATTEASVEAINRERQTLRAALYNGDLDIFMALWSEDAVLMPPNAPSVTGREAIRSWAQDLFNQFAIQLTIISEEVEVFGDWAFVRTTYTTALTPKAGGEVVEESGKNIWIWKREADGSWKLAHDIWNLDNQPAM